ncbi:SIS domain-containing protein [Lentilactobacillus hilgardii]|uniref:SIS domain-containing protein n=1 Tax=Lentilactobacillus hilgardii TaxID=1588 RepID=UPI0021C3AA5E|nr:SIS domain-containing protein [Lentilactobacillus hilgardii]MCP9334414.1 SIS domain-containing protein [Lentilactobacillus hilgardii]MCP9351003.1 SIS domain-containing protein [Lentilactobacillus hilgardii]
MYETIMWNYINEEQNILKYLVSKKDLLTKSKELMNCKQIYFVAHGSSYNAAKSVAFLFSKLSGIKVRVMIPGDFMFNSCIDLEDRNSTWICAISETGTSRGLISAIKVAKERGVHVFCFTNTEGSPIDKFSDFSFFFGCGEENSNAKTKGYSVTLVLLILLALKLAQEREMPNKALQREVQLELQEMISNIEDCISDSLDWLSTYKYGLGMEKLYVIGSGMNFGTAMEGSLKLMETMCIPTMYSDIIEFSHGMHRSLSTNSSIILICSEIEKGKFFKTFSYLLNKGFNVILLNGSSINEKRSKNVLPLKNFIYTQSVLLFTIIIQVFSAFIPELNGVDPNRNSYNDFTEYIGTR